MVERTVRYNRREHPINFEVCALQCGRVWAGVRALGAVLYKLRPLLFDSRQCL